MEWFKKQLEANRDSAIEQVGRYEGRKDAFTTVLDMLSPQSYCQECGHGFWRGSSNSPERNEEIKTHELAKHSIETVD